MLKLHNIQPFRGHSKRQGQGQRFRIVDTYRSTFFEILQHPLTYNVCSSSFSYDQKYKSKEECRKK